MRISDWRSDVCSSDLDIPTATVPLSDDRLATHIIQPNRTYASLEPQDGGRPAQKNHPGLRKGGSCSNRYRHRISEAAAPARTRKRVVKGKIVSVLVVLGGRLLIYKKPIISIIL